MIDVPGWDTSPKYDVFPVESILARINDRNIFDSSLRRVKKIGDLQIEKVVNSIPEPFLTDKQREEILNGLIYRRDNIMEIFDSWWQIKQGR